MGVLDRYIPEGGDHGNKMCQILCSACTLKAMRTDVLSRQSIHDFAILYCREHVSKSLEYVRMFTHILSQSITSIQLHFTTPSVLLLSFSDQ